MTCGCWCHMSDNKDVRAMVKEHFKITGEVLNCNCSCYNVICNSCGSIDFCQCNKEV